MTDLSVGDFLYQSDQELFLVLIEENDGVYSFAAHGWREIDEARLKEYIDDSRSNIHTQSDVEELIEEKGNEETKHQFDKLKQLFAVYENAELPTGGPQSEFALDET